MYKIIYIVALIFIVFSSVIYIAAMKHRNSSAKPPVMKVLLKTAFIASAINLVLGLVSFFDVLDPEMFGNMFVYAGIMSGVETIVYFLYIRFGFRTLKFAAKSFLVVSILEMTVFNYPSFYMWGSEFKEQSIDISQGYVQNDISTYNSDKNVIEAQGLGEFSVSLENFNGRIGTIYADIEFGKDTKRILFKIDASDAAQRTTPRYDYIHRYMIADRENSQTVQTLFSGDVSKINLRFSLEGYSDSVILKGITFNKPIQFNVSIIRFLVTMILPILVYALYFSVIMNRSYDKNKRFCNWAAAILTALVCLAAVGTINYKLEDSWSKEMKQVSGNQITQELVDAFSEGQVNLLVEPTPELLAVENPYDRTARDVVGAEGFQWDHLLFDGSYFSYYGIAPVVLLFWPYHSITGFYFSTPIAILLFSVIGMIGLTLVYMTFIRKWFGKLSSGMVIAGLIMIQIVSGIWFSIGRTDIYEIAESSGFAFLTWGIWLLLSSNIVGKGKISLVKTALASLILGISVMCRPTLAVYCICAVILIIYAFKRSGITGSIGGVATVKKSRYITYIVCAALPMLIIAAIQMWYNNIRFLSPFDFGIQYSLTINDFTNAQYHTKLSLVPLYNYLFVPPAFTMRYPFVMTHYQDLDLEGFLYADLVTSNTSGLFFIVLPMFAYFFGVKAFKKLPDRKSKISSLLTVLLPCLIMPLIIMASVWESGYSVRYMVDFAWQMTLGAFAIFFYLYLKTKNETTKTLLKKFFMFSMVWAIVIGGFQIANQMFNNGYNLYYEVQYTIEQAFAIWKQ